MIINFVLIDGIIRGDSGSKLWLSSLIEKENIKSCFVRYIMFTYYVTEANFIILGYGHYSFLRH